MCVQDLKANEARLQELNNIADRLTAMGHTEAAEKIREQITVSLSRCHSSFVELAESVIPFGLVFPCGKLFSLFFPCKPRATTSMKRLWSNKPRLYFEHNKKNTV